MEAVHETAPVTTTELKVYPNPATGGALTINLTSPVSEQATVAIYNMTGEKVWEYTTPTNVEKTITLTQPAGIYLLSATTTAGKYQARVTLE